MKHPVSHHSNNFRLLNRLSCFLFILKATIVKKSIWMTTVGFLFVCMFFYVITPAISKRDPLFFSSNPTFSFYQAIVDIAIAICATTIASSLFLSFNEDGTELLLMSRPIARWNYLLVKIFVYLLLAFCLVGLNVLLLFIGYNFSSTDKKYLKSFLCSALIGYGVIFLFFGSVSAFLAGFLKGPRVLLINVSLSIVIFVYQIISFTLFKNVSQIMKKDDEISVTSGTYIDIEQKKTRQIVIFNNQLNNEGGRSESKEEKKERPSFTSYEDLLHYYQGKCQKENDISRFFDVTTQFNFMVNALGPVTDYMNECAAANFASSKSYNYRLMRPISPENIGCDQPIDFFYFGESSYWSSLSWSGKEDDFAITVPQRFATFISTSQQDLLNINKSNGSFAQVKIGAFINDVTRQERLFTYDDTYQDGFAQMSECLFNQQIKTCRNDPSSYFYDQPPKESTDHFLSLPTNEEKFYNLAAHCLLSSCGDLLDDETLDKKDYSWILNKKNNFKIFDYTDLNVRYLQFLSYCFNDFLKKQKHYLNNPSPGEKLFIQNDLLLKNISRPDSWFVDMTKTDLFHDKDNHRIKLIVPNIYGMKKYHEWWLTLSAEEKQEDDNFPSYLFYDAHSQMMRCLFPDESISMFCTIEPDENKVIQRDESCRGMLDIHKNFWTSVSLDSDFISHNVGWWEYDSAPKTQPRTYLLVWLLISIVIFHLGYIRFLFNDIK